MNTNNVPAAPANPFKLTGVPEVLHRDVELLDTAELFERRLSALARFSPQH